MSAPPGGLPPEEHRAWDELAAGAALHALEPDEQRLFDLHAADCSRCQADLAAHELVAAQLGSLSAGEPDDAVAPSWAELRGRIVDDPTDELAAARRRHAARSAGSRRLLAGAAAAVVIAAGGVTAWQVTRQTAPGLAPSACRGVAGCHAVQLVSSSGVRVADIVVTGDRATVRPKHLAAPPAGDTYVLWQMGRSQTPTPVAAFTGSTPATMTLKFPYSATAAFAVSQEVAGPPPARPTRVLATAPAS